MKGKSLDDWSGLPVSYGLLWKRSLFMVEKNFPVLEKMTESSLRKVFPLFSLLHWRFISTGCQ
jgi:hypothetical protein